MRAPPSLLLLTVASLAAAACTPSRPCAPGTVLVAVSYDSSAALADTLVVFASVDGSGTQTTALAHTPGDTRASFGLDFPHGYAWNRRLAITVEARANGRLVGRGDGNVMLADACETLGLDVAAGTRDGTRDGAAPGDGTIGGDGAANAPPPQDLAAVTPDDLAGDKTLRDLSGVLTPRDLALPPDLSRFAAGQFGAPCTMASDCAANMQCLTSNGQGISFPGTCTYNRVCADANIDCLPSSGAVCMFSGTTSACMPSCTSQKDCLAGYSCCDPGSSNKGCIPIAVGIPGCN
jgi:hypothetical protein